MIPALASCTDSGNCCVHKFHLAGIFEGKVLQLHHLANLQWAGARWTWHDPNSPSALHCLCLGASSRAWMGGGSSGSGGKSVAPLRGAAWGARARYLMQRVGKALEKPSLDAQDAMDANGCTALNYLIAPLKPPSDCCGTVNFEILQSLLSWTAKSYQTSQMQLEAGGEGV